METKALYIHIPFCDHICSYCDFAKVYYREEFVLQYLERLKEELDTLPHHPMETIYIGGGTPSALSLNQLKMLLNMIDPFVGDGTLEYTIEVNPESATLDKLETMHLHGVNRLSVGVQTFDNTLLKRIERYHTSSIAKEVVRNAKAIGFKHISIDLMYGLPGQTLEDVKEDLQIALSLPINHLSYYSLILEEHTRLYDNYEPLDEETEGIWSDYIVETLSRAGFHRYEVSNYALGNHESYHNKVYWHYENYYGVGIGATGKIDDELISHSRSLTDYLQGKNTIYIEKETLEDTMFNHLMMSLRLEEGLDLDEFKRRYHHAIEEVYKEALSKNLDNHNLVIENNHLKTNHTLDLLNSILLDFLPE
ncbi:radical SAM family heme chaperone HemW [Catenibacterium mitsuokai]|uniref:radical SAM family heme chaperone HemW n=2 Tax=Catenibacterium mitsuokai TaxID=100886 RepID=UPI001C01B434|nr:radical SAM family heme chaperone HemW [Catenibacterium mitsuokai]MBT9813959.1 radical SAM family heme chaperone HemW [Catenibacterium mitsuokai]MEE0334571.1 radical SAM family heme chaperone HemW [Catenibacterium mitsuokai]